MGKEGLKKFFFGHSFLFIFEQIKGGTVKIGENGENKKIISKLKQADTISCVRHSPAL